MSDAGHIFDHYIERWGLDPDRRLYRELKIAVLLPYRNERALVERMEAGNKIIEQRAEAPLDGPAWQRWLIILAAWGACMQAMEEDRKERERPATEAVALLPAKRQPQFML